MTILLTGGGTGGHITPLLAVAHELKQAKPDCRLVYVGERGGAFGRLMRESDVIDEVYTISAGKFRRYHGESLLRKLTDVRTIGLNIRDFFRFVTGFIEAWRLLGRIKPDVIFAKGGFVVVPVGLAAGLRKLPYVTHDSDTVPGLANRLIAKRATYNAVGMPPEFYNYPKQKIRYTGIPLGANYKLLNADDVKVYRRTLNLPENAEVLMITGGSQGAQALNTVVTACLPGLLEARPHLHVLHQVGAKNIDTYPEELAHHQRLYIYAFLADLHAYTGAADVVVTRASATTIAELAEQGKAIIVVPSPVLTAGHQLKNAEYVSGQGAAKSLSEAAITADPKLLADAIDHLFEYPDKRTQMGRALHQAYSSDAAAHIAELLLSCFTESNPKNHEAV